MGYGVLQEQDSGLLKELLSTIQVAVELVVSQDGHHRRIQLMEFFLAVSFHYGPKTEVYDVSTEENEIRIFGVDQADPAGQFRLAVVIAHVKVTGQNQRQRLLQGLFGDKRHLLAVLVVVMETAQGENEGYYSYYGAKPRQTILQECLGKHVDQG